MALILVTNALLLLQPTHTAEQKRLGAITHGVMNSIALAAFTSAVIIIIYNKGAHGAAHFTTAHGRIGLTTYILLIIQVSLFALNPPFSRFPVVVLRYVVSWHSLTSDFHRSIDVLLSSSFRLRRKG